jgi:xanthine/CO dehydrogenase XdhC/CoxF family maturation factor
MLLTEDGWAAGSISGGCLEGDVVRTAWERTAGGPVIVTYDSTADEDIVWGFGLGCNGVVQVLFERLAADGGPLAYYEAGQPGLLVTHLGSRLGERHWIAEPPVGLKDFEGCVLSKLGEEAILLEAVLPPRPLVVFGAGHDAVPLVVAAKAVGMHVTVVDGRAAYAQSERFPAADAVRHLAPRDAVPNLTLDPRTAAVVMTHGYLNDLAILRDLLPSPVGYVGLLGPRRRADRLLNELRDEGYVPTERDLDRLHAPIGLDLGAEGPDEIAVAVVAEILAFFRKRAGGMLRHSEEPLHPPLAKLLENPPKEASACRLA